MTGVPEPSYAKYPAAGDAGIVRRLFAFVIDAAVILVLYVMVAVPAWNLAPNWLAVPITIAESELISEEVTDDGDLATKTAIYRVTYYGLNEEILEVCEFVQVTTTDLATGREAAAGPRQPIGPCPYLERLDFGTFYLALLLLFYAPLMEGRRPHATVGKLALAIRVQRINGDEISFVRAFLRNLAEGLCLLSLGLGYLIALVTTRRQALHDLIAGTVVVER